MPACSTIALLGTPVDPFYRELLPDLKARGKAILVITHDEHYFHLAIAA